MKKVISKRVYKMLSAAGKRAIKTVAKKMSKRRKTYRRKRY